MTPALLRLSGISKVFGAVQALRDVSFEVRAREVHALLGENGAGKSTLVKVMTGAHRPDAGTMEVEGKLVSHFSPAAAQRLGVACVYQQPALFPQLSVAENIALRLERQAPWARIRWKEHHKKAAQLLQRLGTDLDPATEARELSMPEQQLVEIACVVGSGARLVIMDEPTASITQKEQHLLFALVRGLRDSGVGIVYISHRLEEIFTLADRVTVLRDGRSVGTSEIDSVNETELIRRMVGRDVSAIYPESGGSPGEVVLSVRNVSCGPGGLHNICLDVRAGEVVGLAGLIGAGRTELARVLFGITPADAGEIWMQEARAALHSPRQAVESGIAYLPEDRRRHGVVAELAVSANVTMAVERRIFPKRWLRFGAEREMTNCYVRQLEIKTSSPDALVATLSGGNQQKVALARWLATEPKLLILDEPTQGVDVGAKAEIHRLIRDAARQGMAILMISSDLPEIVGMSDRILVMRAGRIVAEFPSQSDPQHIMAAALGHHDERSSMRGPSESDLG